MLLALLLLASNPLLRTTELGEVRGVSQPATKTIAWLGIPYAAPPIDALRWRATQAPSSWDGTRAADRFGEACPQLVGFQSPPPPGAAWGDAAMAKAFGSPVGSEDCLTLNIWRPASKETLPVLVFIHGGANVSGYSGDPLYEGRELAARAKAVVVSVNYRLGVFGFFMHPVLQHGDDHGSNSGNFALLDLISALRFVKTNIAEFGGDAENITVMGQSAGAVNAYSLIMSQLAAGLVQRVIALSGARMSATREKRDAYAQRVIEKVPGVRLAPNVAAFLRAQPAGALVQAAAGVPGSGWSTADGIILPIDPAAAIATKNFLDIPVLIGWTREEGKFFVPDTYRVTEAERFSALTQNSKVSVDDLLKSRELFETRVAEMNKVVIENLIEGTLKELGPALSRVYVMRFDWKDQPEPWQTILGAHHAMDLPFIFHNFGPGNYFSHAFNEKNRPGRETLSKKMIAAIAQFIRTSDPNTPALGGPRWKPWTPEAPSRLIWNASEVAIE